MGAWYNTPARADCAHCFAWPTKLEPATVSRARKTKLILYDAAPYAEHYKILVPKIK
jgi:hypothetical protein